MPIHAGLRVAGGTTRATIPGGPVGDLEVLVARHTPMTGHRPGALPEVDIYDYSGFGRTVPSQDVWLVKDGKTVPGPYEITNKGRAFGGSDNAWAVIATPSRAVASCVMEGAGMYLGTREQAQRWADALNEKFTAQD